MGRIRSLFFVSLVLIAMASQVGASSVKGQPSAAKAPLSTILKFDGSLDLTKEFSGSLDARGFKMVAAANGESRFAPVAGENTAAANAPSDQRVGSLRVTLYPSAAVTSGAKWRRTGTATWLDSGVTENGVPVGLRTVEFKDTPGWNTPQDQWVWVEEGETETATGTYVLQVGSLRVTLQPSGVLTAGAKWRRTGTSTWLSSGVTEPGVPVGDQSVEFKDVAGWTKPPNQSVTIHLGETATATGTYVVQVGSLNVTLQPPGAVTAGAKWRRTGTATWLDSDTTETGVPVGQQTVEFKSSTGWTTPPNQSVTISAGETTNATGTYVLKVGSVRVTLYPSAAVTSGAKWRRNGTATWLDSGVTENGVPVGLRTVEFKDTPGWNTPQNQSVDVDEGETATAAGIYVLQVGSLRVTLQPSGAVTAGAKWRRTGTSLWLASGFTESGIPVGQQTVEFKDTPGWITPLNQSVTVTDGDTTTATGMYVVRVGSLQVTLQPPDAVTSGAKWRRTGTTAWLDSETTETGVPVGRNTVEFKALSGWNTPPNQSVTVTEGDTTTATGTYVLEVGSLRVTLYPSAAVTSGAKWRRTGTLPWLDSGATETGIPVGQKTIEFNDVAGWTTPQDQSVRIDEGNTATATGTYVLQVGSLRVTLQPSGAVTAGARWRRTGTTTWLSSGVTEPSIPVGQQTVEFKAVSGWTTPQNQSVTIANANTTTATGTYILQVGSLLVTLQPPDAVTSGAKWRRTGTTTWLDSGTTETGIPVGQRTVEFKTISGWNSPQNQSVTITNGNTTTATGTYRLKVGSLRVTLYPSAAVTSGAKWRRTGTLPWFDSGATETGVPIGQTTVEFSDIAGWTTPQNQSVRVDEGETATAAGTYVVQLGSLQVTLQPPGAVTAGAKWRRAGTATWLDSGTTETGIPVGDQTVEFRDTPGWTAPPNQPVTIQMGLTTKATGTYVLQVGSLLVTLQPPAAVTAGAKWRRAGTTTWLDSGTTETGIPVGDQTIEFKDVPAWDTPPDQSVTITLGATATTTGTYVLQVGSLLVTLQPPGAVTAGAKWRRAGTTTWLDSGTTETGVPVGDQTVEFKDVPDWDTPPDQSVAIRQDETATATGTYVLQVGSLLVTLQPHDAVTAGAKWRRSGTTTWLDSGTTETGIPVGDQTVEFSDVEGWTKPSDQPVTILHNETTTAVGTYVQLVGSLQVAVQPPDAVTSGAKWRRSGTATWQDCGCVETGVPVGSQVVEFKDLIGWVTPANQTITVIEGDTTITTGTYELEGFLLWHDDTFTSSGDLTPPGSSATGWSWFMMNNAMAHADHDTSVGSYRGLVTENPDHFRTTGASANLDGWMPYSLIGPNRVVRSKWYMYGDSNTAGNLNQMPNMRLRLCNRFAVNSMLEVFHHNTGEGDPIQQAMDAELRPSTDPTSPSVYRVDFDLVDVPYLVSNASVEGAQRAFEAYGIYPNDNGFVAMAESVVGSYATQLISKTAPTAKVYVPDSDGPGDLGVFAAGELDLSNTIPGPEEGSFGTKQTDAPPPIPTYSDGAWGVTLDTTTVPTDRIGVGTRNFNPDRGMAAFSEHVRVAEGKQYAVRFHLTSTQQVNQQSQFRLRARSVKFAWSQKFEVGGAWATDGGKTYPLNQNNSIAQQALPGTGTENPDTSGTETNGGWYTMIVQTPMSVDIRPEFPAGTPLAVRMPVLAAQPGPGENVPSRRDLLFGLDLVDTLSAGAGRYLEQGNVTLDRIEVRVFDLVPD